MKSDEITATYGAPGEIRTHNRLIRSFLARCRLCLEDIPSAAPAERPPVSSCRAGGEGSLLPSPFVQLIRKAVRSMNAPYECSPIISSVNRKLPPARSGV
jgi:hypothetical protein